MMNDIRDLDGARLLLVEDDADFARILIDFLAAKGAAIQYVADGSEAIKLAKRDYFDVIVLDLRLAGENGFMVAKHVKSNANAAVTPAIIVVSAYLDPQNRIRALEVGVDALFSKPVPLQELFLTIKNFALQKKNHFAKTYNTLKQINKLSEAKLGRSGHGEAVEALCLELAELMTVNPLQLHFLAYAAALHDFGQIFTDADSEEWTHGDLAADIFQKTGLSDQLTTLIKHHHPREGGDPDLDQSPALRKLSHILQQAERAMEVYRLAPEEIARDVASGFLSPEAAQLIRKFLADRPG